jgi:hypothetical protein
VRGRDEVAAVVPERRQPITGAHWYALNRLRTAPPDMRTIGLTAARMAKSYENLRSTLTLR